MTRALILLVEDDRSIREALGRFLFLKGYNVVGAEHGKDALDTLKCCVPALIILDLMMPEMHGQRFLQELRQRPAHRDVPVLVTTAVGDERLRATVEQLGVQGYFQKPVDLHALCEKLARLIEAPAASRAGDASASPPAAP